MLWWPLALTGSLDQWRCVNRSDCAVEYSLRPSRHVPTKEDRSAEVVAEQTWKTLPPRTPRHPQARRNLALACRLRRSLDAHV